MALCQPDPYLAVTAVLLFAEYTVLRAATSGSVVHHAKDL